MAQKFFLFKNQQASLLHLTRNFSIESPKCFKEHYKLLIVGGGAGGISTGAKFTSKLGATNIAIVDPAKYHCNFQLFNTLMEVKT